MAEVQSCSRCQAEVAADAPEGICPACLVRRVIDGRQETEDQAARRSPAPRFVPPAPAELADELGLSAEAIKVTVHRLRRRYGELLRTEIAQTVSSPEEIEDELRNLFAALGGKNLGGKKS